MHALYLGPENIEIISSLMLDYSTVDVKNGPIKDLSGYDLIVSFGYRHILTPHVLDTADCRPVNIHISYLPFNRGAHPNFWAHYDGTPHGVTIHEIDSGIDTGPIIAQRPVTFASNEVTFRQTYERLIAEAVELFFDTKDAIMRGNYPTYPQRGKGSHHFAADLPDDFQGWDSGIDYEISRLQKAEQVKADRNMELIQHIQDIRSRNNVNWMNILRIAFQHDPKGAASVMQSINLDDEKISELLKELSA